MTTRADYTKREAKKSALQKNVVSGHENGANLPDQGMTRTLHRPSNSHVARPIRIAHRRSRF